MMMPHKHLSCSTPQVQRFQFRFPLLDGLESSQVLLTAYQVLLATYNHQQTIPIGIMGFHRPRSSIPSASLSNIRLLTLASDQPLPACIQQIQQQLQHPTTDPTQHITQPPAPTGTPRQAQQVPPYLFHQTDEPEPGPFLLQALTAGATDSPPLSVELALSVNIQADASVQGALIYDPERYTTAQSDQIINTLHRIVLGLCEHPERPVSHTPLLTDEEYQRICITWNTTATRQADHTVCDLFADQVTRNPQAPAVQFLDQTLTYQALDQKANQVAHLLQANEVGPETLVGVCVERSPDLPIAFLGILKAGGAYLPLDPTYPTDRLTFLLTDAQVSVVITQKHLIERLHHLAPTTTLLCIEHTTTEPTTPPPCPITPDSLAYVIYTSGSTGKPKGTLLEHRGLVNLALSQREALGIGPGHRVLQFASLGFDASVWEMAIALLSGATLTMAPKDALLPGEPLVQTLRNQKISMTLLPPSVLASLPIVELPDLQTLIVGGEACSPELVQTWAPKRTLINAYGPTEATVYATMGPCIANGQRPPIGRPIANTQIYILNPALQPVPVGVPGELCIGGIGVARGYVHRPTLTAERFIPNPFARGRLYRTGDLAQWLPDGQIEFLGRLDHQVKVRGFRIELGEIESVLHQHATVETCVVIAREDTPGQKRLVAYIIPHDPAIFSPLALRDHVQQCLPDYMVPAAFVQIDSLPLTPNGKLDQQALPMPAMERQHARHAYVPPRTDREHTLATIWARLLQLPIETIGTHDNFFELGGDSILSIQVIAAAHQSGLHLLARHIFQYPTIAELAIVAEETTGVQSEQDILTGSVPLTPIQHWFFEQHFPDPQHWNQAMLLTVSPTLPADHLRQAFALLLDHHDALRLRFTHTADGWQQTYGPTESVVPFEVVNLAHLSADEQTIAIERHAAQTQSHFDLATTPRLRAVLFQRSAGQSHRLLIVINYLAVDGVTWRIFLDDMQAVLRALQQGQAVQLSPKTTSYRQWAHRLIAYAQQPACRQHLVFWQAETSTPTAPLPLDTPDGDNSESSEQSILQTLSIAETHALLHDVPKAYRTRSNDLLLAALLLAYHRWSGEALLRIELEGHGREDLFADVDVSRTIGWFTSLFPVLLHRPETGGLEQTLIAVKEHLRAIPQHGINYGILRALSPDTAVRSQLQQAPRPDIRFNYLGQFDQVITGMFQRAPESIGPTRSPRGQRTHLLVIEGMVVEGQLQLTWMYSANLHRRETIATFAHYYMDALRALIDHCTTPDVGRYTPSDFDLVRINDTQLARIAQAVGGMSAIADILPLASTQHGILFHSRLSAHEAMYLVQWVGKLHGNLDVSTWQQAWDMLIQRHPILRTCFIWEGLDEPLQIVQPQVTLPWVIEDWRSLGAAAQEQALQAWLTRDQQQGLDPTSPPLMRMALFRVSDTTWMYLWTFHHGILDGWSSTTLLHELMDCTRALSQNQLPTLPATPSFREYIARVQQHNLASAETFWHTYLAGFNAPTPLLQTYPANQKTGVDRYSNWRLSLPQSLSNELHTFGRTHQVTLGTILQGVWALLLSRYSGEKDVVFGLTVSGRTANLPGVESIVGLCNNTIPMRVLVSPDTPIPAWLLLVQEQQSTAREFEHTPLVTIQQWSALPADTPLFQSLLSFENYPGNTFAADDGVIQVESDRVIERTNYPLALAIREGDELELRFMYDTHAFDEATISRIGSHMQTALHYMVAHPDAAVGEWEILPEAERHHLIHTLNATHRDHNLERLVPLLAADQSARLPEAIAVVDGPTTISYAELNQRANRLAHYLHRQGVGPDVPVCILAERSLTLIVAALGILKAGGAYVPIDPTYPTERIGFVLEDTQATVILTQSHLVERIGDTTARVLALDTAWDMLSAESPHPFPCPATPANLAYIIYTSGSTGMPKGVMIEHRSLLNLVHWYQQTYALTPDDRSSMTASPAFDVSVSELWPALVCGATIVVADRLALSTPRYLRDWLLDNHITIAFAPTPLAEALINEAWPASCSLRTLITAGDRLHTYPPPTLPFPLTNNYGPTEATVYVTSATIPPVASPPHLPTIGRTIDNTQVYLLDAHQRLVPFGAVGELYIGGIQVGRGYLRRPERTTERFIPDPFSDQTGARLYRTGDLAHFLPDGNIAFLNRMDFQIKLRGYRIELGEIESVLSEHPAVQQTVVVARGSDAGKYLVAYVVGSGINSDALRTHLAKRLPDYMIPSDFVFLEALPLTPSGKINRLALPDVSDLKPKTPEAVAPRSTLEQTLAGIWQQVLQVPHVGIYDNFFDLGGNSLRIGQVYDRLREVVATPMTLMDLFTYPTIAGLSHYLTAHTEPPPESRAPSESSTRGRQRLARARQHRRTTKEQQ